MHPDIKNYHKDFREKHYIAPLKDRFYFMGQDSFDVRWNKIKPASNIKRDGRVFLLEVALPGFKKEEITISIEKDILTIRAEKTKRDPFHDGGYIVQEFDVDVSQRKFKLAEGVRLQEISARYRDGILKLTFRENPYVDRPEFRTINLR